MIPLANYTIRFTAPDGTPDDQLDKMLDVLDMVLLIEQVERNIRLFLRRNAVLRPLEVEVKD